MKTVLEDSVPSQICDLHIIFWKRNNSLRYSQFFVSFFRTSRIAYNQFFSSFYSFHFFWPSFSFLLSLRCSSSVIPLITCFPFFINMSAFCVPFPSFDQPLLLYLIYLSMSPLCVFFSFQSVSLAVSLCLPTSVFLASLVSVSMSLCFDFNL